MNLRLFERICIGTFLSKQINYMKKICTGINNQIISINQKQYNDIIELEKILMFLSISVS